MASTVGNDYNCLICASSIPNLKTNLADKLEIVFLLRILFEIPQEAKLLDKINASVNSIRICTPCACEFRQCEEIYSKICEEVKRFWECRNKVLDKFSGQPNSRIKTQSDKYDDWVFECQKFVKDRNLKGFGFPFTVQDLKTLLPSSQSPAQDDINRVLKNEVPAGDLEIDNDSIHISEDPFDEISSPVILPSEEDSLPVKQEPESEEDEAGIQDDDFSLNEDDDQSSDNDSDYQPSPSKKPKLSPAKRQSIKKCAIQVKRQGTQIRRGPPFRNSKPGEYPDFKRDPTTKKFHCIWEDCSQKFVDKDNIQYHWDKHRCTPRQKCQECPQAFYTRKEIVRHREMEHPKEGDKFDCDQCGRKCYYREAFLSHQKTYHAEKSEEKRKARMQKKEEDPIKKDPVTGKWRCWWPECDKSYLDKHDLKFHLDRHRGTPRQKCGECGQLFYSRGQLVQHREKEHEKDKTFGCEICGGVFDTSGKLYAHKTYKHSEKGTGVEVVCEICGKSFKKAGLQTHMKGVHGGDGMKSFVCHLCPEGFKVKVGLKRHLGRVHGYFEREGDKEKLERQREYENEKKKGTVWRCVVKGCRVRYVTEEGLKNHVEKVHKGKLEEDEDTEWRFRCEVCGKGFHVRQKWTRHAKQHEKNWKE